MQKRFSQTEPLLLEKVIASLSYITASAVGFIWLLIAIFTKNNIKPFLKYHIFQSIFLSIAFWLANKLLELIMSIFSIIPFLKKISFAISYWLGASLIPHAPSIIDSIIYFIIFYLAITSFMGQYSYLPWVSEIIKANVKNS